MAKFMKKELVIFFTVLFVAFFSIVLIPKAELAADSEKTETTMIGDLNNTGIIETGDVLMLLRHLSNETTKKHPECELKGNSLKKADIYVDENKTDDNIIVNQADVLALLRYIAAKSSSKIASKHPDWLSLIDQRNSVIVPTDITLDKATMSLMVGQKDKLTATVVPENAEDKRVYWKSSNEKVAEVDAFGNIKAVAEGECTVNATTWNGKTKACIVKITKFVAENGNTANNTNSTSTGSQPSVTGGGSGGGGGGYGDPGSSNPGTGNPGGSEQGGSEEVETTGLSAEPDKGAIFTYQTGKMSVTFEPDNATDTDVTYSVVEGQDLLDIDPSGNYTAKGKEGTARIRVELNSNTEHNVEKTIEVKKCRMDEIKLDDDIIKKEWDNTKDSVSCRISAYIYAEKEAKYSYITNKEVEWSTSDDKLCKINVTKNAITDGEEVNVGREVASVEIARPGIYNVTAKASDTYNAGALDMCVIKVEGIKLTKTKEQYTSKVSADVNLKDLVEAAFCELGPNIYTESDLNFEITGVNLENGDINSYTIQDGVLRCTYVGPGGWNPMESNYKGTIKIVANFGISSPCQIEFTITKQ